MQRHTQIHKPLTQSEIQKLSKIIARGPPYTADESKDFHRIQPFRLARPFRLRHLPKDEVPVQHTMYRKIDYMMAGLSVPTRQESPRPAERRDLAELEEKAERFNKREYLKSTIKAFTDASESRHRRNLELAARAHDRRQLQRDAFHALKSALAQRRQQSEKAEAFNSRQLLKPCLDHLAKVTANRLHQRGDVRFLSEKDELRIEAWVNDVESSTGHHPQEPSSADPLPLYGEDTLQAFGSAIEQDMDDWHDKWEYYHSHRVPGGYLVTSRFGHQAILDCAQVVNARREPVAPKYVQFGLAIEETMQSIHEKVKGLASRAWDAVSATISGLWR
ncbi:hypothetical protein AC579_8578 [Pseudocercospora musae]|uniref:Sfi1 spindle body domain-containing protein n=1 Tax=Pseudocercospora musae TaxID=113226 RepID=A0A139IAZ3_9PEZI|nr:hypothetical protein AC579_8578 [Pseudocercospora musae]